MAPYGIQVVLYLFLAGVAAGAAFFGSFALSSRSGTRFSGGKRSLVLAIIFALAGSVFLILDLASPKDFLLILTSANAGSAISWGTRILVIFILSASFVWATVRTWGEEKIGQGFKGADQVGLILLRIAALGLAIYPAFVLRQGEAFPLWQNPLLIPLFAVSAFHAGAAASSVLSARAESVRRIEIILGSVQLLLLVVLLINASASVLPWVLLLFVGTVLPLILSLRNLTLRTRVALILLGAFAFRYWLIAAGQTI